MHIRMVLAVCLFLGANAAVAQERSVEKTVGDWELLCFDDDIAQYRS